jgi:glycosyltransferase involved in cell wall biosynthesis
LSARHVLVQLVHPRPEQLREHLISLVTYLPRRLFEVTVVGELDRALQDTLSRNAVRWVNVGMDATGPAREGIGQLRRLLAGTKAELVHMHGYPAAVAGVAAVAGWQPAPRLVYTAHELSGYESGALAMPWAARRRYRRVLARMDSIITFSQRDRQALAALVPQAAARAEVIPPGIDPRRIRPLADPGRKRRHLGLSLEAAVVGTVGELGQGSDLENFLQAAAIVNRSLPNVEFAMVGEGPLRPALEDLAHQLGLTGCTAFLGRRYDLPEVLATFNVVVVTTEAAGGAQTALQALALDIPVVAEDTGGLREILGGLPDVPLVPPGDPEALAAAIMDKLEAAPLPSRHSTAVVTAAGLSLSERDMLVSTEAFDLDRPGLEALERQPETRTPAAELALHYGVGPMVRRTTQLYRSLLEKPERR